MKTHTRDSLVRMLTASFLPLLLATTIRAQRPELILQSGHHETIRALAISPDGKYLASAGLDRTIILWEIPTGKQITSLSGHAEPIFTLAFSPDGSRLASGSSDGIVYVWNVAKGVKVHQATLQELGITSVAFSPDGGTLAISCADKKIMLWRIAEKSAGEFSGYSGAVTQVAFSPDGKYLAATGRDKGNGLMVWNLAAKKEEFNWVREDEGFTSLAFSPDGHYIAAACADESIAVWDTRDWKVQAVIPPAGVPAEIRQSIEKKEAIDQRILRRMFGDSGFVTGALAFTSGTELTYADGFRVRTWDVKANKEVRSREINSKAGSYVLAVDKGNSILAFNDGLDVRLLDLRTKQFMELKSAASKIHALDLMYDSKALAAIYGDRVAVWNYSGSNNETEMNRVQVSLMDHLGTLIPSTGEFACHCAGMDNAKSVKLLDLATLKPRDYLKGHTKPVTSTTIHPDGNTLASCSNDGTIKLWDVKKRALLKTIKHDAQDVAFSPDGKLLAAGSFGKVTFWDTETWEPRSVKVPTNNTGKMLFASDSKVLAITGVTSDFQKRLVLLDTSMGEVRYSLLIDSTPKERRVPNRYHAEQNYTTIMGEMKTNVTAEGPMAFSRDARLVASEELNRTTGTHKIKIWDVNTGREMHTLEGHAASIRSLVFTLNDKVLVSGSWDKTIKFWGVDTGAELGTFVPLGASDWVIFTPDGRFDTNTSLDDIQILHWVMPHDALNPLPLDIFMRDYFEPKLLERILAGEALKPVRDISTLNRTQPTVVIKEVKPDCVGTAEVTVEVANAISQKQFDARGRALESGVYDVRLFRDGQLVGSSTAEDALESYARAAGDLEPTTKLNTAELRLWQQAHQVRLDRDGRGTLVFRNVRLPQDGKIKEVAFSAYAFNNDRVKSSTARKTYALPTAPARPRKGRAYVVTMGVNLYENPAFNLSYAANDARRMQQALTSRLTATGQYDEVVSISLISDATTAQTDATKANFRAVLRLLSGRGGTTSDLVKITNAEKLRAATPDDLVLILYAGHGFTGPKGLFYLIPYDTGEGRGEGDTTQLRRHSISSDELGLWLRDVDAEHMALIVDACYSAATVENEEFKPGPLGSRGLGQLAYDKGMLILTATQADNVAHEDKRISQGLLSYVLVKEGMEEMKADSEPANGVLTLREWLRYGVVGVPRLFDQIVTGKVRAFDDIRDALRDAPGRVRDSQQPSLFDFARQRGDVALVNGPTRR